MERITPVDHQTAQGKARQLLDAVKTKLGIVPNMTRSMAVSPAVLEAYLGFSGNTVEIGASHNLLLPCVCKQPGQQGGCDSHASRTMCIASG